MSEERELYWYDDATYDIGFYNYYQRTIDPSPWAFVVCFLFCAILAIILPRYLSNYWSLHTNEETEAKPSENVSNTSIFFESQEFISSEIGLHDERRNDKSIVSQSKDDSHVPPISDPENTNKVSLERKRRTSMGRFFRQRKGDGMINASTQSNGKEVDGSTDNTGSTDYTNMEENESGHNASERGANDKVKPSEESPGKTKAGKSSIEPISRQDKHSSFNPSESETLNPLEKMKRNLLGFPNPADLLSESISWEEEFDSSSQSTLFFHTKTGRRTTEMPAERISGHIQPWYFYYCSPAFRRKIRKCRRWDEEMEKLLGLALPYTAHTIVVDVFGLLEVGIIGRSLGTSNLSAYFATEFAISFATMFFHGILASLKVLVSQADGAKNIKLAGTYVQIGIWTHHLLAFPLILYGWDNFDEIVLRLGLDEDTAESAEQYARFVFIYEAIGIYDGAFHCVMDITGHEKYSAISNGVRAFVSFLAVLIVSTVNKNAELWMVGAIHLIAKGIFIFFNICVIVHRRWLDNYWNEWERNPFKDWRHVKALWEASLRLSSGRVIENCEWNILFVFSAIQGPAEVAIWGLLGELWDFADHVVVAISDASKVRCAHLLGKGLPEQAKYSSEKSLLIGVAVSIIMSIFLGFFQSTIPMWLTNDLTLQRLLGDMIPLLGLAVASLSFGSVCWSILCAQGRSHLATAVTGFGSLAIALPLASISNFWFNLNLQGLIASLIIGYASSGFFNSILMLTSNWSEISQKVKKETTQFEGLEKNKVLRINPADSSRSTEVKSVEIGH